MGITQLIKQALGGSRNQRLIKHYRKIVDKINAFEPKLTPLSDAELCSKTTEFKQRLTKGETLDHLLPEAFAVVRETAKRVLGMRHFDVQLIGGMVLHQGKIAEMGTGEGKTLMSTLPAYLNAISGQGVHLITVNDYLAKRDAEWMGPIYNFLGLTVGVNLPQMTTIEKRSAFAADITYGTNNEYGFDYLRDNMAFSVEDKVQRALNFAIVDEVDSILIDEARTPLIISGPAEDSSDLYIRVNRLIPNLKKQASETEPGDYVLDEKTRQAHLTEQGLDKIEELLTKEGLLDNGESLYAPVNIMLMHHINAALRAHSLFHRDVHYLIKDNEILIVDEHTGRSLQGRRWSDGLHQAIEAKEGVKINNENQTLATITFQNYFRLYNKLAGMTGTADTEAYEFQQIYGLEVVVIPSHRHCQRIDQADQVYLNKTDKFTAVIQDIKQCLEKNRPVLVGTASIETSEFLSKLLQQEKIKHQVLNAKFHQKEAEIIAQAGRPGNVTIATNMAGRGTDIVLGGNLEASLATLKDPTESDIVAAKAEWQRQHDAVVAAGGLHVIGSERHESRRIDNQLRGRCARQGDPGSSRFYLSLQDDLMRIFASDRVASLMQKLGMPEGEAIEHPWINKAIENAQRKVEGHNFDIRKELLEFDDVANAQRKVIYAQRASLMSSDDISGLIIAFREDVVNSLIDLYIPHDSLEEQWQIPDLENQIKGDFGIDMPIAKWLEQDAGLHEETLRKKILAEFVKQYQEKEQLVGSPVMRHFEKTILLQHLDTHWKDHLAAMDYLRQGIHLRGYAQKNPKQEYKREAFNLFSTMLTALKHSVISTLTLVEVRAQEDVQALDEQRREAVSHIPLHFEHAPVTTEDNQDESAIAGADNVIPFIRTAPKVGRNDICPCGSGKKYKHCHGQL